MMQVSTKTLTGAKIIIETLKNLGVSTVFGYPGGIVLKVYDELAKQTDIKHILSRHEQASVHQAEGYTRANLAICENDITKQAGAVGVVLVTSGPGATNIVTGLANAYLDGYPLVVLTGQVSKELIGKDAFQEVNIVDITRSCTKKSYQVTNVKNLEETIVDAFTTALSGKKGPVVIDLAKNIFVETTEFKGLKIQKEEKVLPDLSDVVTKIKLAKHPLIVAGGGVTHSQSNLALQSFARQNNIPVVSTMMGLGNFLSKDPLYFGMIGLFGDFSANKILRESDLILSLGARFNDRITCCFKENLRNRVIQVDISQKTHEVLGDILLNVKCDIASFLDKICEEKLPDFRFWANEAQILKSQNAKNTKKSDNLHSFEVVQAVSEFVKGQEIPIATEVGQHQLWVAKNFEFSNSGQFITSGGSGTMGFGFPASIGASLATKDVAICFTGDGSFQMNLQELATCVDYNLPVKIFVLNNGYLGMVRQLQEKFCEGRYSQTQISNPDFVKISSAYGIEALRVQNSSEIQPALARCFATDKPFLIDFVVEPQEFV